jgi:5-methylcytosine-specific restriction endonuclease McrA
MNAFGPSSLDSNALVHRLHQLVCDERSVQVDFLLHLDEFDRRQAFLQAGFGSLWEYCLRALHLREGAAGRRIGAMRVLRRFPALEAPLRDGRLCLSTVALLAHVLTDDNLDDLVVRAAFRTKAEVDHLVASLQPRTPPREGIRKLPDAPARREPALLVAAASPSEMSTLPLGAAPIESKQPRDGAGDAVVEQVGDEAKRRIAGHAEMQAVSANQWSLRVTIDTAFKEELENLTMLLSHKVPRGDLAAVLREAVRCAIEKHGKRKGAVPPARERPSTPQSIPACSESSRTIPANVRRQVWQRDGGQCAFVGEGGRRCGSRWQLEVDHVHPASLGGASTSDNLRLVCRKHNILYAEEVYGCEYMARFRRESGKARLLSLEIVQRQTQIGTVEANRSEITASATGLQRERGMKL